MSGEKEKILEVKDLTVTFHTYAGNVQAVRGSSFDLYRGEVLAIVGESGSGKSVTVKTLMGLLGPTASIDQGTAMYNGQDLLQCKEKDWEKLRGREIAMIFQDPLSSLNPIKKVGKQISEIFTILHKMPKAEAKKRSIELMAAVGIPQPVAASVPWLNRVKTSAGAIMPPAAASTGRMALRTDESCPQTTSRLISRPTVKKKTTIKPSLMNFSTVMSRGNTQSIRPLGEWIINERSVSSRLW